MRTYVYGRRLTSKVCSKVVFYNTLHLYYVHPIDGVAIITIIFLPQGDAKSRKFSGIWLHFFNLQPDPEKKTSEYCNYLLLPTAGIKPGPPAQQASELFFTPILLGCSKVIIG